VPRIYRSMAVEDGQPLVGRYAHALGVRVVGDHVDVIPDDNGCVHPQQGGMSVAPSLRQLPSYRVPMRLRHLVRGARGNDQHRVWSMGEGDFTEVPVAPGLQLRPDSEAHGVIEPSEPMALMAYEAALAATRNLWSVDEG
jgi:hypothetical protein